MLTAQDLHEAFMELGAQARHEGKVIDLAIYGGSALMLASNFRSTQEGRHAAPAYLGRGRPSP